MQPEQSPAAGETIGERLKRLRLERGLSQRELAAPGVSYAYISRIEAGTRQPSVKALRRLAAKLGVSADYLERGSDLDAEAERELRLADLELAVRLGDERNAEPALHTLLEEALGAGDRSAALRARVSLAALALSRAEYAEAIRLLESAVAGEPFAPAEHFDIYSSLGRAYASSGRPDRAAQLFEDCMEGAEESGADSVAVRYATLLSYALSDMGDVARAEAVVRDALDKIGDTGDPYMRVRLYWSVARLAHTEGREAVALENVRKAIALLQATEDSFHLARAHILAAGITISRGDADSAGEHVRQAKRLLGPAPEPSDAFELKHHKSRIAHLQGDAQRAATFARQALEIGRQLQPADEGIAAFALADALALGGDHAEAERTYSRAVSLLEEAGRWRPASTACRSWARLLRELGRESEALDVMDRAAELGMRASPETTRAER